MYSNPDKSLKLAIENAVRNWHPDLMDARFAALFSDKPGTSNGRPVVGKATAVGRSSIWLPLLSQEVDFVLWVWEEAWVGMSPSERDPFIDTLLCGCRYDSEHGRASTIAPDFEGYYAAIRRHGMWSHPLKMAMEAKTENVFVQQRLINSDPMVFDDTLGED